jgi:hypothetical protein
MDSIGQAANKSDELNKKSPNMALVGACAKNNENLGTNCCVSINRGSGRATKPRMRSAFHGHALNTTVVAITIWQAKKSVYISGNKIKLDVGEKSIAKVKIHLECPRCKLRGEPKMANSRVEPHPMGQVGHRSYAVREDHDCCFV